MGNSNNNGGGSNSNNDGGNNKTPADRFANTFRNLSLASVTTFTAFLILMGVLAAANYVLGGPSLLGGVFGFLGFEVPGVMRGPGHALFTFAILLVLGWGVNIAGNDTSVPFWVGIGLLVMILVEYVFPDFVVAAFAPLNIGTLFLGMPLSEVNVARTFVLGITFIFIYYVVLFRAGGAIDSPSYRGSKSIIKSLGMATTAMQRLLRKYASIVVSLAAFLGVTGFITATGTGQAIAAFFSESVGALLFDFPVWSGYMASLGAWYANTFADLPVSFGEAQFGVVLLMIFVATAAIYVQN